MARQFVPKIVTANHLMDGDAIYLTAAGAWSRHHDEAQVADNKEAADALLASVDQDRDPIVGPYLADVSIDEAGRPKPVHFREAFRTRGPSNYFHGKQAEA